MARRKVFPVIYEGDGAVGTQRSPGVKAAQILLTEVNRDRNKKKGLSRKSLNLQNGAFGSLTVKDNVIAKQYLNLRGPDGKINPHIIGHDAWDRLWDFAVGPLGGQVNALVVEEFKRREAAKVLLTNRNKGHAEYRADVANVAIQMCTRVPHLYRYNQTRPFPISPAGAIFLAQYYGRWDCSSSVLGWFQAAGIPNPQRSDGKYDGYGHTGSLWAAGVRVTSARAGDLVFYGDDYKLGYWRPQHVAMAIDPYRVATFGSNPPRIASIGYRKDIRGIVNVLG